jgi:DNA (cytosine-5)-methyltransferase 1
MAGYRELLAVEWDDNAVATFKLNFPGVPVYHGDIHNLSVEECLKLAGVKVGELDVLDGSPPCQGFSTAGKRQMDDPRNELFREYVRLLKGLQPRVFIMENVSGLVKGKMKLVFAEIMRELKASGYKVKCRLLNAMWFSVPQSRQRLIWIGVREDLTGEPCHPEATSRPVTVREAMTGCPDYLLPFVPSGKSDSGRLLRELKQGQSADELLGSRFGTQRLAWNRPCPTVSKSAYAEAGYSHLIHPELLRSVSIGELRRVTSYPDGFAFAGKYTEAHSRIGNSVPPLFMRAIAEHVRLRILTNETT